MLKLKNDFASRVTRLAGRTLQVMCEVSILESRVRMLRYISFSQYSSSFIPRSLHNYKIVKRENSPKVVHQCFKQQLTKCDKMEMVQPCRSIWFNHIVNTSGLLNICKLDLMGNEPAAYRTMNCVPSCILFLGACSDPQHRPLFPNIVILYQTLSHI